MERQRDVPNLDQIQHLAIYAYVPFADIERAVPWPTDLENRSENDAEHSFSLGFIGAAIAEKLGLNSGLTAEFALVHDFIERFTGDVSVWDDVGRQQKQQNEAEALVKLESEFKDFPWIYKRIVEYESLKTEEACLVYALDKLLPTLLIVEGNGYFWKQNKITFEDHLKRVQEIRPRISKHPVVLDWYDNELIKIETRKDDFFV